MSGAAAGASGEEQVDSGAAVGGAGEDVGSGGGSKELIKQLNEGMAGM